MAELTEHDEGKRVVDQHGETIGMVKEVQGGRAFVDPDAGITEKIKSSLGWDEVDESDYMLEPSRIESVTDDEIRLRE